MKMRDNFRARSLASDSSRAMWALTVGACAAALVERDGRSEALDGLRNAAARGGESKAPSARPIAAHLRGTLAALQGDRACAAAELERAIAGYDRFGMRLYAASVRLGRA